MDNIYRVVAIDPALDKMGLSVLDINVDTKFITIVHTETVDGVWGATKYPEVVQSFGMRNGKLKYHLDYLTECFRRWKPDSIVHESPFLGRFPQSYAALVEVVLMIRMAAMRYDFMVDFDYVDPPSAKKAVGVSGKSKDKTEVMDAIRKLPKVIYDSETNNLLDYVSEHESDSIAVGYWKIQKLFRGIG